MDEDYRLEGAFRWTSEELVTAHAMNMKVLARQRPRVYGKQRLTTRLFMGFVMLLATLNLILGFLNGFDSWTTPVLMFFLLLLGVFYFLSPWLSKKLLVSQHKKRPDADKIIHYSMNRDVVKSQVEGLSENSMKWEAFVRVVRTPQGFLFYPNEQVFHWLPFHAFSSEEDLEALANMARQQATDYWELDVS